MVDDGAKLADCLWVRGAERHCGLREVSVESKIRVSSGMDYCSCVWNVGLTRVRKFSSRNYSVQSTCRTLMIPDAPLDYAHKYIPGT